jgi:predicted DsbA family dithiol-disulfide isomerase
MQTQKAHAMNIEIWSDIVCPWCYIGKRRFEKALARFAHRDQVEVTWRSFELDPGAPRVYPGTLDEMLAKKMGGSLARAAAANQQVTALAAQEGLEYHLDQARPGNSFDAHRLVHFAAAHGLQDAMQERLLRAYFSEGRAIGDPDTLASLAAEVGLDAAEARAVLAGDAYAAAVRADEQRAAAFGIAGVPFFAIDEQYGISGAQPSEVFLNALEQIWAALPPRAVDAGAQNDAGCADGACRV